MKSISRLIPQPTLPLSGVVRTNENYRLRRTRQSQTKNFQKKCEDKNSRFSIFLKRGYINDKVGNTLIAISCIDTPLFAAFATAACCPHRHSQVAESCTLWQNRMIVLVLVPVSPCSCRYCLLVQQCFHCRCCYCLLLLSKSPPPLLPVDYCFVSTIF